MTRLFLLVMMLTGCVKRIPHQEHATALVWDLYGGSRKPPDVEWIEPSVLDCADGRGFYRAQVSWERIVGAPRECVLGVFWEDTYKAQVAHRPNFKFSTSAFAHELYHAILFAEYGSGDPDHAAVGWRPGGLVEQAESLLERWVP